MRLGGCNRVYCGILRARQDTVLRSIVGVGATLEGLGALGRLSLEGLLLFVYPNLLSARSIYYLEGGGEVLR